MHTYITYKQLLRPKIDRRTKQLDENLHTYIHTYIHTYTHTHIHTYIQYIHITASSPQNRQNSAATGWKCSCMHIPTHTCIHTYIYTYIHTYITYKQLLRPKIDRIAQQQDEKDIEYARIKDFHSLIRYMHTYIHICI